MRTKTVFESLFVFAVVAAVHAHAATTFDFTGGFQTFIAPAAGGYRIVAYGAEGGVGAFTSSAAYGAEIAGDFALTAGETLQIAVGGMGFSNGFFTAGGGGGTFVVGATNTPLVIAGGGGGTGVGGGATGGQITTFGAPGSSGGSGGTSGGGGAAQYNGGGGGGGFLTNGGDSVPDPFGNIAYGGKSFLNGLNGGGGAFGGAGGFGGGGGTSGTGGGGGGGYSGGGGGFSGGGGGGSFLGSAASNPVLIAAEEAGNGYVVITDLGASVPEPKAWALMLIGFAAIGACVRSSRRTSPPTTVRLDCD